MSGDQGIVDKHNSETADTPVSQQITTAVSNSVVMKTEILPYRKYGEAVC
jgi:hypothetical protein